MNKETQDGFLVTTSLSILPVEIVALAEDGGAVYRTEGKSSTTKGGDYDSRVFTSWKDAKKCAVDKARSKYNHTLSDLEQARKVLDRLADLEEPEPKD